MQGEKHSAPRLPLPPPCFCSSKICKERELQTHALEPYLKGHRCLLDCKQRCCVGKRWTVLEDSELLTGRARGSGRGRGSDRVPPQLQPIYELGRPTCACGGIEGSGTTRSLLSCPEGCFSAVSTNSGTSGSHETADFHCESLGEPGLRHP